MHAKCLILSANAAAYASELAQLADEPIPVTICTSVAQALDSYADETVAFGDPSMIAELLPHAPAIEWVQSSWAGVTPLIALDRHDYQLTGIKDVFGPQMSEYVVGYLLAHELRILQRSAAQHQRQWFEKYSGSLAGKRLGIMGSGSIGRHIAATCSRFGLTVSGLSRSGAMADDFANIFSINKLHDFLNELDYLVSTLPQTADTDNLLDASALAQLPAHAYFINVGRSNVVDDAALVHALQDGQLAGATLDVFDEEPLPQDSPLWTAPNLAITAHIAAVSRPSLIVPIFIENYRRYVADQPLQYLVDFGMGY